MNDYETTIARLLHATDAIAFSHARHAFTAILSAIDARPGDEVVLPALTCKVVPLAVLSQGLKPVYVDVSMQTLNLGPEAVERALSDSTRAVLFQHTYGNTDGLDAVARIASNVGVPIIEDCAQCMPYTGNGGRPGVVGLAAIISHNLRKPVPAGAGGLAVTSDPQLAERIRATCDGLPTRGKLSEAMLRAEVWVHKHFLRPATYWPLFELKRWTSSVYRVRTLEEEIASEITSRACRVSRYQVREALRWLSRVEDLASHRRACCEDYVRLLKDVGGIELPCSEAREPLSYFPVLVDRKEQLLRRARRRLVELIAWPIRTPIYPIAEESELSVFGYQLGSCPVAEEIAGRLVGLPTDFHSCSQHRRTAVELIRRHNEDG